MGHLTARVRVTVNNPQGLHARPADLLMKTAHKFASSVEFIKGTERVDGKSILAILTLAAVEGTELWIEANGHDAEDAVNALAALFAAGFSESGQSSSR